VHQQNRPEMYQVSALPAVVIMVTVAMLPVGGWASFVGGGGRGTMVGGWSDIPVDNEGVKNASFFAVQQIQEESNSLYSLQLDAVLNARVQLVAGLNYNLTLHVATTNCRISSHLSSKHHNPSTCTETSAQTCQVIVYVVPWKDERTLVSFTCNSDDDYQ